MLATKSILRALLFLYILICSSMANAVSDLSLADSPLFVGTRATPLVMLDVSRDHQLFFKAYNDYTDLDDNKVLDPAETTYRHATKYYGYFDSGKCYTYSTANSRFEPAAITADRYCSNQWSGNFLNWLSMSRLDVMRKVLYGGYRSTDDATGLTVLERASIPTDAHAWAKYYPNEAGDIGRLTPFSGITAAPASQSGTIRTGSGSDCTTATGSCIIDVAGGNFAVNDQISVAYVNGAGNKSGITNAKVVSINGASQITIKSAWIGTPPPNGSPVSVTKKLSTAGVTFCNATFGAASDTSEMTPALPVIRAAKGNYSLWSANERWQCYWSNDGSKGKDASNGNDFVKSGIPAYSSNPSTVAALESSTGKYDFVARVKVCDRNLIGNEDNCKAYGSNLKPSGLLQQYGEGRVPRILFGLMTPSYSLNVSGGVLRKALGKSLSGNVTSAGVAEPQFDEINPDTGAFNTDPNQPGGRGIIHTLNKLRIDGYSYNDGTYNVGTTACDFQRTGIVPTSGNPTGNAVREGHCSSWGNPMSELYMESLRYLAGASPTAAFSNSSMARDVAVGLPQVTPWVDPITSNNYCASLNVLMFNASVSTNDNDQVSGFSALRGSPDAVTWTNLVGDAEGLNTLSVSIGRNGVINNDMCTAKTIGSLGNLSGICPEAPSQAGTYLMAGMAYRAHTNRIRDVSGVAFDDTKDKKSLRVNTYGVALATNVPRIPITVGGNTVYIQPAYRLDLGGNGVGTGTIVDFKLVSKTATTGTFYVNWEDSNFGGDFDQDVIGTISYEIISATKIAITTKVIAESTNNGQGFGYILSGTDRDGPHFHSGIEGFNFTDPLPGTPIPSNGPKDCSNCQVGNAATTVAYNVTGAATADLKDPLYYAAKYGGFRESTTKDMMADSKPEQTTEWDAEKSDGTAGSDGLPDNYFYVVDAAQLQTSLARAFSSIADSAGGAAVATASTSVEQGTTVYQGLFDPGYWTGDLVAANAKLNGSALSFTPVWSAAKLLTSSTGRIIFTNDPALNTGLPFQWGSLTTAQQRSLELAVTAPPALPTDQGVLDYIRGSAAREGSSVTSFRVRTTKLGDIVNSAPVFVGAPNNYGLVTSVPAAYSDDSTYGGFSPSRASAIYVGANDGMLHAFDAATGREQFAYIPSMVIPNLKNLANAAYAHKYFVDGSPVVADIKPGASSSSSSSAPSSSPWRTVLAGSLGAGGKGLYALDITAPDYTSEAAAKNSLIWEFTHSELGYVFQRPMITRIKTSAGNKWVLITGNGYNSTSGKAQLFIVDLEQKNVASPNYIRVDVDSSAPASPTPGLANGLGGVAGIDVDNDGNVDYVYGGDLQGNMWKFDLSNATSAATITVSKLSVACRTATSTCTTANRQPITAAPAVTPHPSNASQVLVYFGTGKYLENADASDISGQSMYGIWDQATDAAGAKQTVLQTRDTLLVQEIKPDKNHSEFRQVSNTPMDWSANKGWVEDLPDQGERLTGIPAVFKKSVVYNTFVPTALLCDTAGGYGYLMVVNYENGGLIAAFDLNGDGTIDNSSSTSSEAAAGMRTKTIGGSTLVSGGGITVAIGSGTDGKLSSSGFKLGSTTGSRLSWREIIKPE
ncbi:MAG TPA: PilC/PilY family type IV pilus protein [Rhodocyclaceae bacterium]|nr:PilC/PilY family type IV pilus protein [Rhodocyclaceae bacterium]